MKGIFAEIGKPSGFGDSSRREIHEKTLVEID